MKNTPERLKVFLVERNLVFYRQELYQRLGAVYNMTYLYSGDPLGDLPGVSGIQKLVVPFLSLKLRGRKKIVWLSILSQMLRQRPHVVITEISISLFSTWLLFMFRPFLGYKLVFWGHGLEDYWRTKPGLSPGDRLRLLWFGWSDGVIVYGRKGLEDLRGFLPKHRNLVRSPNAQNSDLQSRQFQVLEAEGRDNIRTSLGINNYAFVYIGRLTEGKGLDRIPQLADYLKEKHAKFELHFIGSGEAGEELKTALKKMGVKSVFHGTVTEEAGKGRLLYACDCLLGPGPLGLAIVDALGYGCTVLALSDQNFKQKHGPEIEYVSQGVSGYVELSPEDWMSRALRMANTDVDADRLRRGALALFHEECQTGIQLKSACQAIEGSICLK